MIHDTDTRGPHVAAQVAAAWSALQREHLDGLLRGQDVAMFDALREVGRVRDFVGTPKHILGSDATKHGEIAEEVHVGITRARDVLFSRPPSATFDGVGRTSPVDYIDGGHDIQSKYYNGIKNTLAGVVKHTEKYPDFAKGDTRYHIPSDQYGQLRQLQETDQIDGFSDRSVRAVRRHLDTIEGTTGRPADEVLQPGEAKYPEVQQGRVHETLNQRERELCDSNEELKESIRAEHGPSLGGAVKAAGLGAAAGGGVRLAQALWVKMRAGKNPFHGDFDASDWADVGIDTAKGAVTGGISGGAVYLLTSSTHLAAPFAGAVVSSLMGVGSLVKRYEEGEIDADQFQESALIIASDAAIIALASAAGQAVIPIPLLGAFVGSLAGKFVANTLKSSLSESEAALIKRLEEYEAWALSQLDAELAKVMHDLDRYFSRLENLAALAFDLDTNAELRLHTSIEFAEAVGVAESVVLHNTDELDTFMLE